MKVWLCTVGRPDRMLAAAIAEYETRAARYWKLEHVSIPTGKGRRPPEEVIREEGEKIASRLPAEAELIAVTRKGSTWSSRRLAVYLQKLAVGSRPGAAFVIGGAYGLAPSILDRARRRLSLSAFTMPHDLARLVLAEQLYRAGTIVRREPYHKGDR